VLSGGCLVVDEMECRHREDRAATVPAPAGLAQVDIEALAGSLTVQGKAGSSAVEISGSACARWRRDLEGIQVATRTADDRVVVEAVIPEAARRRGARLDLTIDVPAQARLVIDDGSGDAEINGVAAVTIDDGTGDLMIGGVPGEVSIEDGSGDVVVEETGPVRIDDESGDVSILHAAAVTVENDDSGDIELASIAGDVNIFDDGSGDIEMIDVGGNLRVEDDGSGDLEYSGVKGTVDVPRERSRRARRSDD
jgi:DUF4097 and DUF4098 domain-containing protein YvlB